MSAVIFRSSGLKAIQAIIGSFFGVALMSLFIAIFVLALFLPIKYVLMAVLGNYTINFVPIEWFIVQLCFATGASVGAEWD